MSLTTVLNKSGSSFCFFAILIFLLVLIAGPSAAQTTTVSANELAQGGAYDGTDSASFPNAGGGGTTITFVKDSGTDSYGGNSAPLYSIPGAGPVAGIWLGSDDRFPAKNDFNNPGSGTGLDSETYTMSVSVASPEITLFFSAWNYNEDGDERIRIDNIRDASGTDITGTTTISFAANNGNIALNTGTNTIEGTVQGASGNDGGTLTLANSGSPIGSITFSRIEVTHSFGVKTEPARNRSNGITLGPITYASVPTPIDAIDDTPAAVNSATGASIPNVVTNDTLNGVANPTIGTDVTVDETGTAQDGTTTLGLDVTPAAGSITLNPADGVVTVAAGTTPGTYVYTYQICEVGNATNCDTATVTVVVNANSIDAIDDTPAAVNSATGASIPNVVTNDTLNGVANPTIGTDVTVDETGTAQDGTTVLGLDVTPAAGSITLNPADGVVTVAAGTTPGTYVYTYQICEVGNATNCDTAEVAVVVDPTVIDAIDDAPASVDGSAGATIPNVIANDTLGGVANPTIGTDVTINETGTAQDGTTTLGLDVTPAAGSITLNPADGVVTVAAGTTPGTYAYTYQICEVGNATNCDTAEVTIVVQTLSGLINAIAEDLETILSEDLANTLTQQSNQISGYSASALDRLQNRSSGQSANQCATAVNAEASNILFDVDRAIIKPQSSRTLDNIATILMGCPGSTFEIAGHTDSDASDAYNIDLSQRRVVAVRQALAARGVDTTGYIARGYGESQPIASNATAAGKAQNRRVEFRPLNVTEGHQGPCDNSFSLVRSLNGQANENGAKVDGQFVRDQHDCVTDRREVFEGSLSYLDTEQGQTQSVINLSYRREQYRGSESVLGYFVGLYGSRSEVTRLANGEIDGFGLNGGIYGANRLQSALFVDYYLGAAAGRHTFDLAFGRDLGTIDATGEYDYLAGFAGTALSGQVDLGDTTLTPRVGFDYVYTPGADVDVVAELSGLSEAGSLELDAISGGRVFAEVRSDLPIQDDQAKLWINPRVACYQSMGTLDGICGVGGSIGIESGDADGVFTYAAELDGEWGKDYTQGSLSISASRDIGLGTLSGDAGVSQNGNTTFVGQYEIQF